MAGCGNGMGVRECLRQGALCGGPTFAAPGNALGGGHCCSETLLCTERIRLRGRESVRIIVQLFVRSAR